ncbi:hypothetical protein RhiirA5_433309 [Rhizophagus irregularis]|uniref:Integrase catalytic domain-containing protein n=1 Tax=Rhizophagus irregularis TaxID=588596 RepID=A0A2N0NS07_9GLOM|nr:hypothetical protein RhiirA5_433309 [Rhizophagus irregularis]
MPYDEVGHVIYLFYLNIVNIVLTSVKDQQGILTFYTIAQAFKKVYDDTTYSLTWPKLLITDKGLKFKSECEKLMTFHDVKIQKAKSKRTVGIVKRYNHTLVGYLYLVEKLFSSQDASDLLTLGKARSQVWIKNLPIAVESINNLVTKQLGISSTDAIKKRRVSSSPSYPRNGPVGYEEEKLPLDILSVSISLTQKNQPVLYWLVDNDSIESKRSLVRKELLVIPDDIELPPQKYTCEYLHNTGKPCYRSCMKLEGCRLHWKTKPCIPCAIYGNLQVRLVVDVKFILEAIIKTNISTDLKNL